MRRVALLFGGQSVEHEVSVSSAREVARAMCSAGLDCIPLAVTGEGRWLVPEVSAAILEGGAARVDEASSDGRERLAVEPGRGLVRLRDGAPAEVLAIDVVFPLIHGWGGEDGRLQGALDLAGIPYAGAGVAGSAVAMDKALSKRLFHEANIPVLPWVELDRSFWAGHARLVKERIVAELGYPVFVKPANGGSSVGVSRVGDPSALEPALDEAFACDRKVLIERALAAREIECAVLGNDDPQASGLGEILPSREFYDYAAKYLDGTSGLLLPAPLEPEQVAMIRALAQRGFQVLDLQGFARVDFLVDRDSGRPYLNEINTLPGFTTISMFPKLWEAAGLAYPELVARLVELALERRRAEEGRRTRWPGGVEPAR